ncbi:MAG: hypothetical protein HYS17_07590 [Micavibrio aeruginosavorus]|uniref:Uncharacterized protein n=1 Tax=Micavibrio aeruginosavorus TaxID=349221 RepID=A0A7T5UHA3_9BACT|nr:MAG: hypothetical protein HYS17_07590 [Micavibrio aeruginosavorus]
MTENKAEFVLSKSAEGFAVTAGETELSFRFNANGSVEVSSNAPVHVKEDQPCAAPVTAGMDFSFPRL